ncbi:hypothetical protein AMATHDRAFT_75155 [Amanita thiersii Skay4041]|uniref:ER membrane protein complex subunit 2 n=1 Tax=Amanita thiersii Skay4041 TaxID=703135 RepID=A0A2A9NTU4_9AGAR|nr:hypothetical protein AMATHDRAFT_75155 [Amanita thiersii Skay4041]
MAPSVAHALETLARYRANNTRASQETFLKGAELLKSGAAAKLNDEGWAFIEQLMLASIDIGRLDVADRCLQQLADKFPGSSRVEILQGIRMEATEPPNVVLQYYDKLIDADSGNAAAWKRQISVLRRVGKVETAVEELTQYLDTFYNDLEGWLELADIYSSCNLYTFALQSLSHALLLSPQNPFTVLQFAETAYSAGDVPLALKMFLSVIDMDDESTAQEPPRGISVRAWYGIKLCSRRLIRSPTASASKTVVPKNLNKIEELATEQVLLSYRGKDGGGTLSQDIARKWMSSS